MSTQIVPNARHRMVSGSSFISHGQRPRRPRRAPLACQHCRRRKVRCNLTVEGPPCVNCRLDGLCCAIPPRKFPRYLAPRTEDDHERPPETRLEDYDQRTTSVREREEHDHTGHLKPAQCQTLSPDAADSVSSTTLVPFAYYPYLTAPNLSGVSPSDIAYLDSQKCFDLPSGQFLETLLSHYFLYVHPCLPVINEAEFWSVFRQRERGKLFSLLVFQAMLFVASSYLPVEYVKRSGAESIIALRDTFYRRAKLIYDFNLEDDQLRLCQAAILLTYRCSSTDQLSNTMWLSLGIQHARAVNAHVYYRHPPNQRAIRARLKRIWWCLILRDRLLSLGVRRNLQIHPSHFDTTSHSPLGYEDLHDEVHTSEVYNAATKTRLIEILTSQCYLAVAVTQLLMTVYPPVDPQSFKQGVSPISARTNDLRKRLQYWESTHMIQISPYDCQWHRSVVFYCQLTCLYYQSARIALYHYISFCLSAQKNSETPSPDLEAPGLELMDALTTMNDRIKRFVTDGTAGQLPIGVVACIITPQILVNINLRLSENDMDRNRHEQLLKLYAEISRLCSIRYDVTYVSSWIRHIVHIFNSSMSSGSMGSLKQLDPSSNLPSRSSTFTINRNSKGGVSELLRQRPSLYFELVSAVDFSISTGLQAPESSGSSTTLQPIQSWPLYQEPSLPISLPSTDSSTEELATEQPLSWSEMESLHIDRSGQYDFFSLDGMCIMPSSNSRTALLLSENEGIQINDATFIQQSPAFADGIWRDLGLCGE
ncbi:fungal-specific transcription factor domain-containing protein [Aspergillus bertholletiae]|uniref:Fungal-specific transcription factor domain-containing protein n=1 Tax=Aspergillus bertholletiae TaxID=1226010 RepID=A0A5N7B075_9EURO|nr:fungal-specific transcription factor domain-containing protein [Aspergillus bertholletiae]